MKLKRLTLHNIASIEEAVIDFEHGPLADDSRFLICGPTGAGKSTLLDAVCLALYNTTPRLESAAKESYTDRTDSFANGSKEEVGIDDPRMLMRRGAVCASVELLFTDKDDRTLKASWSCARARNKANGKIQNVVWTLSEEDDTVVCSRKSDTQRTIQERLGLTFEQFCRTTLLAQGDFTKFLKSPEREKSEILEKLTGTEIYSEVSREIHRLTGEKREELGRIEERMKGIRLLSEEELQEIARQETALQQQLSKAEKEEKRLAAAAKWWNEQLQTQQELERVTARLARHQATVETEAYRTEEALLNDWHRTEQARTIERQREENRTLLASYEKREAELYQLYLTLSGGCLHRQEEGRKHQEEMTRNAAFLEKERSHEPIYNKVELIASLIRQIEHAHRNIDTARQRIAHLEEERKGLATKSEQQQQALQQALEVEKEKQAAVAEAHRRLQAFDMEALTERNHAIDHRITQLKALTELRVAAQKGSEEAAKAEKVCTEQQEALTRLQTEHTRLCSEADHYQRLLKETEALYEKQQLACDNFRRLQEVRSTLAPGDRCPLCGETIRELPHAEAFQSILAPTVEALHKQREEATLAQKRVTENETKQQVVEAALQRSEAEKKRLTELQRKAEKAWSEHPLYGEYGTAEAVEEALAQCNQAKESVTASLRQVSKEQQQLSALQKETELATRIVRNKEKELKAEEEKLTASRTETESLAAAMATHQHTLEENHKTLAADLRPEWWEKDGESFIARLRNAAERYRKAVERGTALQQQSIEWQQEEQQIAESKGAIEACYSEWEATKAVPQAVPALRNRWATLRTEVASNHDARQQTLRRGEELQAALEAYLATEEAVPRERLARLMQHTAAEIETLRKQHQELRDSGTRLLTEKETAERHLTRLAENRPLMNEEETPESIAAQTEQLKTENRQREQALGSLRQQVTSDNENKQRQAALLQQIEAARQTYEAWARLHALFGSSDGKKFRNIAQSYVLRQLLLGANHYLYQFTDRYDLECQPGSLTILLRDKEAGGVTRPTTTISGGESFLISLSLALGLSTLNRKALAMDILFIDEGFGTLDSSYLSTVMDALERLHQMGGKKVGIISHVESLKERLTTQIQVIRENNTLSRVKVVSTL